MAGDYMAVPNATDILALRAEHVADFIHEQTSAKTLSVVMKQLNEDLLRGDETASSMAEKALNHLGFRPDL